MASIRQAEEVKMLTPLISVVLPVYNCEEYIAEAVESILCQSYRDFELIVIDDGSTDKTPQILRKFESADLRIKLISRQNMGLVASLNEGVELARGEWIARMDADDISFPHRIERQLQWLKITGADITGSWFQYFGTNNKSIIKTYETDSANKVQLLFGVPFCHPTVMMRTSLLKQLGYYKAVGRHKNIDLCEDYDLWERAARAGWKMTNVQEVLLMYRQHADQISTNKNSQQIFFSKVVQRRYWEFVSKEMQLDPNSINEMMKIQEPSPSKINMDYVDSAFIELLQRNQGDARDIIYKHATSLYFRVAADCLDIVMRWRRLNQVIGRNIRIREIMKFWFIRLFRVRPGSRFIVMLRRILIVRS